MFESNATGWFMALAFAAVGWYEYEQSDPSDDSSRKGDKSNR